MILVLVLMRPTRASTRIILKINKKQPVGKYHWENYPSLFKYYQYCYDVYELDELEITIGEIIFKDLFRVVEKDDVFLKFL